MIIGGGFFYFTRSEKGDEKRTEPEIVIPMSGEETVPRIAPIVKKEEKSSSEVAVKSVPAFSSVKPRKMKIKRPAVSRSFIPTPVKKRERKQFFPKPAKEPEKKVEFSIVPKIINLGQVQIVSNSGTAIYIDGKLSGKGKYEASEMEIGLHRVRLINRNLNKTHSFTFNLKKGQTYIKEHNFRGDTGDSKPSAKKKVQHGNFGTITIKSTPQSLVYISGRMSGKTPIIVRRLPAGNYSIRLINRELNITRSFIAVIKKGEHLVKEVRLK